LIECQLFSQEKILGNQGGTRAEEGQQEMQKLAADSKQCYGKMDENRLPQLSGHTRGIVSDR
jgi:hypothetical protein